MPSTRSKATRSRGVRRICLSEKTSACEQACVSQFGHIPAPLVIHGNSDMFVCLESFKFQVSCLTASARKAEICLSYKYPIP